MEARNNMDDLLTRYLFNEAGPEEISIVTAWINESKENYQRFEELKKTVALLAEHESIGKIRVEDEWNHLQGILSADVHLPLQSNKETAAPRSINNRQKDSLGWKRFYRLIIPAAVAASVIVLVLVRGDLFHTGKNGAPPTRAVEAVVFDKPANAVTHHEINTSGNVKTFSLPDGSRVRLSGSSELTYSEAAGARQRNVSLKGEADFSIAKDKSRPFIVSSGVVSTMAVGTRFAVTAFDNEKFIQVKLMEGKVLVRSEKIKKDQQTGGFYLLPGQKLIYDKNRKTVKIKSFRDEEKRVAGTVTGKDKTVNDNPLLPHYDKTSWFMFNNQSLDEIFHALEFMYDAKIVFEKKDVDQLYFVGTFSKSDSVENILSQIALLNKLTVTKKNNTYTIEKKK